MKEDTQDFVEADDTNEIVFEEAEDVTKFKAVMLNLVTSIVEETHQGTVTNILSKMATVFEKKLDVQLLREERDAIQLQDEIRAMKCADLLVPEERRRQISWERDEQYKKEEREMKLQQQKEKNALELEKFKERGY